MDKQEHSARTGNPVASFRFAFAGIWTLLRTQRNAQIHFVATLFVISAAAFYRVTKIEWCLLIFAMSIVWLAEALNTAVEFLADAVHPEIHPLIKNTKDVAAGGVLIAAIGAVVIGILVFWSYLL